jgi:DNA-directed RNA polymerase specialized sigma24 family protein
MSFPATRYTLIHRVATANDEDGWAVFLQDYWRPLCGFAIQFGAANTQDAEDVAATTLEAVIKNDLLKRWVEDRRARLSTLLCSVVRRVLALQHRKRTTQQSHLKLYWEQLNAELSIETLANDTVTTDERDLFYREWSRSLLLNAVESLLDDYHREGRGNYFRVLFGRICEQLFSACEKPLGNATARIAQDSRHAI